MKDWFESKNVYELIIYPTFWTSEIELERGILK